MISKEVFEAWKESEATKQVFKILLDFRQHMMESFANGRFNPEQAMKAAAQCQANQDLSELDYKTIREFYGVDDEN